ncbi:MAG: YkgJ family cysteine cluster protein [Cyclobacteriaceae bacterium]|nr:YkgJ family cysteine cluster protein [Cyclobacteriaceae bacterium]
MTLEEKVAAVEEVFLDLDRAIAAFQQTSGLHCLHGCGKCCFKPDIEATALEFLPFALHLYRQGVAEQWHEKLVQSSESVCLILNPTQAGAGLCSEYRYRGLICRLFGYSARINKYGARELVTCQILKTEQATSVARADDPSVEVPLMTDHTMRLHAIDPDLARDRYPINQAIRKALEQVMHYYAYRDLT